MPRKAPTLLPKVKKRLARVGEQIRLARLRRNYTAVNVAERSGMSRETLRKIEKGDPNVNIGSYVSVLHSLGMDADVELLAYEDSLGRNLEDIKMQSRQRASGRRGR
ncbi:MAG: helix-turn-helix transcriptional regulator [Proteobacteria bacterium]|nr:helix-turn-helix transcriptional regulator [Pseudomonadota bacterium]